MIRQLTLEELLFVCQVIGYAPTRDSKAIAELKDGDLQAAVVYDRWSHTMVQVHVWAPKTLSKGFLKEVFRYPFEIAGREIMLAVTPDGEKSMETASRLGFKETHRIKDGWKIGVDMVVQELRKSDCRWLKRAA